MNNQTEFSTTVDNERKVAKINDPYELANLLPLLLEDNIRAIRISNWRSPEDCSRDIKIMHSYTNGVYAQEPTLAKGGPTVYDYEGKEDDAAQYFEKSKIWNPALREMLYPIVTSADRLAMILAETHPGGVAPEQFLPGKTPSMQVIRRFEKGSRAGPHVDRSDWDWPNNVTASSQKGLISAVCYHQVAKLGGELVLYGDKFDIDAWRRAKIKDSSYEIDRDWLSKDAIVINPTQGELVLFNAHRVHEVREILIGTRITSSNFYAWRGVNLALGRFA